MTVFEFAVYRAARQMMTRTELRRARFLAQKADAGDRFAASALKKLINRVLFSDRTPIPAQQPEEDSGPLRAKTGASSG